MRVLISGLPLFAGRLAQDLSSVAPDASFKFFDTYNSKWAQLKFLLSLPFADLVISFNGVSDQSGSLDWVIFFKKKLVMQWMGTDILMAQKRQNDGTINRKYIDYAEHFHDAPWFQNELSTLQIDSKQVHFKFGVFSSNTIQKYQDLEIVTYIPTNRKEFYGFEQITAAALAYPQIVFNILAMETSTEDLPRNIKLLGWQNQEQVQDLLQKCFVCIRNTEHDGFSVIVLEALAAGTEVIWSYDSPNCHQAKTKEELIEKINHCLHLIKDRNYFPNFASIDWVKKEYSKETILNNYLEKLTEIAKK